MKIFPRIIQFLKEVRIELKKVNWPSRQFAVRYTLIVIGVSLAVAIFLGGLDVMFLRLLRMII